MIRIALAVAIVVLAGCATTASRDFIGAYVRIVPLNGSGSLEVRDDGSYVFWWEDIGDILEPDGTLASASDEEFGHWHLTEGAIFFSFEHSEADVDPHWAKLRGAYQFDSRGWLAPIDGAHGEIFQLKEPNQAPQLNAGSRPSSDDSSASETPSSLGPRV